MVIRFEKDRKFAIVLCFIIIIISECINEETKLCESNVLNECENKTVEVVGIITNTSGLGFLESYQLCYIENFTVYRYINYKTNLRVRENCISLVNVPFSGLELNENRGKIEALIKNPHGKKVRVVGNVSIFRVDPENCELTMLGCQSWVYLSIERIEEISVRDCHEKDLEKCVGKLVNITGIMRKTKGCMGLLYAENTTLLLPDFESRFRMCEKIEIYDNRSVVVRGYIQNGFCSPFTECWDGLIISPVLSIDVL